MGHLIIEAHEQCDGEESGYKVTIKAKNVSRTDAINILYDLAEKIGAAKVTDESFTIKH